MSEASDLAGTVLTLDAPEALDAAVVGAKAARLASARRAGLPVLPGWVVPVSVAAAALEAGSRAIADGNSGRARRAVFGAPVDGELESELAALASGLDGSLIVRSSSPLEDDMKWSGAFASVAEVQPDELSGAIRSCWSSVFSVEAVERAEGLGVPIDQLRLGVLIQPELVPTSGGTARVTDSGVEISAVAGHPGPMLAGLVDGLHGLVDPDSPAVPESLGKVLPAPHAMAVARLARRVFDELGDDLIEWAVAQDEVHLLQSQALPRVEPVAELPAVRGIGSVDAEVLRSVAIAQDEPNGRAATNSVYVHETVMAYGAHVPAAIEVVGDAAGALVFVRPHAQVANVERSILVAERPVPALAPLLIGARGLVVLSGSRHAHLIGVARSLGVPVAMDCDISAVVGDLADLDGRRWLGAIDSARGVVAALPLANPANTMDNVRYTLPLVKGDDR